MTKDDVATQQEVDLSTSTSVTREQAYIPARFPSRRKALVPVSTPTVLNLIVLTPAHKPVADQDQEQKFRQLVAQWRRETRHVSSIHEKSMNWAYQKIIGMGKDALPFIFRDFEKTHDHWLWALQSITDEDPAPDPQETEDFDVTVEAWLNWARERNYL